MYGLMMDTTANPKQTDSRHVMVARADEELAHAYEQITRAHEEIGRTEEQLSELQHDVARQPSDHPQSRMNTFRPAVPSNPPSLGRRAVRAFISLALLGCIGVAAMAWQSPSSGDAAKQMIARWAPLLQSMARDLATVGQRIEQLKASIDQLRAGQQQMSREIAKPFESKASEQNLRRKASAPPPRPTAASTRKPVPTLPSPQATAQPQAEN